MDLSNLFDLADLRKKREMTLKEVAHGIGVSLMTVSHYENGLREPGLAILRKISDFYGISIEQAFVYAERSMAARQIKINGGKEVSYEKTA